MSTVRSLAASERKAAPTVDVTLGHDMDTTWPQIEVPFPDGVVMTPAVKYSTPAGCRPLTLDLYRVVEAGNKPSSGFPIIMFIHGGSWARGDSRASRPLKKFPWVLAAVAARGYVVASIDYRMVGEALWPAHARDVKSAVKFLRKHAAEFGGNPHRIAAWGCSCGGHLTGILAATAGRAELASQDPALAEVDDSVQAAVSWYGGFNMESITQQAEQAGALPRTQRNMPEWNLLGGMPNELDIHYLRSAGPVNFVSANMPPMLLIVGDQDVLIPYQQSIEMAERMKAVGAQVQLEVLHGVGHDFAGQTYEETLKANQYAMDITMKFFDEVLSRQ